MMARKGRASAALATSAVGSFVAGTLATLALTFSAPLLASVALAFGPAEYFALTMVAFTTVAVLIGASLARGLFSLFLGLALGLVGIDQLTGSARFSFGIPQLLDGIDVMILVIGLFAVGETLFQAWRHGRDDEHVVALHEFTGMSREDWSRSWRPWLRGTAIGFPLGVLPCGGSVIPTVVSYMVERRLSRRPEEFGQGAIEGVAGPEAANNAAVGGSMVPTLALGIPGSATTAIILAALIVQGIRPGPHLFNEQPTLLYAVFASMLAANLFYLVMGLYMAKLFARISLIPPAILWPAVFVLSVIGAYGPNQSYGDIVIMLVAGVVGFLFRRTGFSPAPLIMGLVLGGMLEETLKQSLIIFGDDVTGFLGRPIALVLFAITAAGLLWPVVSRLLRVARAARA
jgi:putative tricarboxylic transport membrane protein